MEAKTQYKGRGNVIVDDQDFYLRTANLVYDALGRDVQRILNEEFKGIEGIEDTHEYWKGQPLAFSNTLRALIRQKILKEIFPRAHLLSYHEMLTPSIWTASEEMDSTYADLNGFVLYPNPGPNEELRQRVLDIFGKETRELSETSPLVISGLKPVKSGSLFVFEDSQDKQAEPEPSLRQSGKSIYIPGQGVVADEKGIYVDVPEDQSGIRRLYRGGAGGLNAWSGDLLYSVESGRVQVLFEPKARARNLESRF